MFSAPPGPPLAEPRREDLHEAGEDHGVGLVLVDPFGQLRERGRLPALVTGERHVVKGHAVRPHDVLQRVVVADHGLQAHGSSPAATRPSRSCRQCISLLTSSTARLGAAVSVTVHEV